MVNKLGGVFLGFLIIGTLIYLGAHLLAWLMRDHLPW